MAGRKRELRKPSRYCSFTILAGAVPGAGGPYGVNVVRPAIAAGRDIGTLRMSSLVQMPWRSGCPHGVRGGAQPLIRLAAAVASAGTWRLWATVPSGASATIVVTTAASEHNSRARRFISILHPEPRRNPYDILLPKPFGPLWPIPLLDEEAVRAVRNWHHKPTVVNGQPVPVRMTATVNFTQQ